MLSQRDVHMQSEDGGGRVAGLQLDLWLGFVSGTSLLWDVSNWLAPKYRELLEKCSRFKVGENPGASVLLCETIGINSKSNSQVCHIYYF